MILGYNYKLIMKNNCENAAIFFLIAVLVGKGKRISSHEL